MSQLPPDFSALPNLFEAEVVDINLSALPPLGVLQRIEDHYHRIYVRESDLPCGGCGRDQHPTYQGATSRYGSAEGDHDCATVIFTKGAHSLAICRHCGHETLSAAARGLDPLLPYRRQLRRDCFGEHTRDDLLRLGYLRAQDPEEWRGVLRTLPNHRNARHIYFD